MNKLKNTKKIYDDIEAPHQLSDVVDSVIHSAPSPSQTKRWFKPVLTIGVSFSFIFTILLNTSPVLASSFSDIPILNQIVKFLTFTRYEEVQPSKHIYVTFPILQNTGQTELENQVNAAIKSKIGESVAESEQFADELYQSYVEAGYAEDEIEPLLVEIDYHITFSNERYLSFIMKKYENIPRSNVFVEQYYYNLDLKTGEILTLENLFGTNYVADINAEIKKQIKDREAANTNELFFHEFGEFETIENHEKFYINDFGQVVIVFDKYEIAPGYMGLPEFIIKLPMEMNLNES